jgi:uncharacterized GH25 family protein
MIRFHLVVVLLAAGMLVGIYALGPIAIAAQTGETTAQVEPVGLVLAPDGNPAAGAEVWFVEGYVRQREMPAKTKWKGQADEQGRFALSDALVRDPRLAGRVAVDIWARDAAGRLGGFGRNESFMGNQLTVQLRDVAGFSGRILDEGGQPVAGARVEPQYLNSNTVDQQSLAVACMSPEHSQALAATTGDDGSFVLKGVPKSGSLMLLVDSPAVGRPNVLFNLHDRIELRLGRAGALVGQLAPADGVPLPPAPAADPPAAAKLGTTTLRGYFGYNAAGEKLAADAVPAYRVSFYDEVPIDAAGRFKWSALPPGEYELSVMIDPAVPLVVDATSKVPISPGGATEMKLPVRKALRITGRVVDSVNGKPVAGATVDVGTVTDNMIRSSQQVKTDSTGRFTVYGGPGTYLLRVPEVPEGFAPLTETSQSQLEPERSMRRDVMADADWGEILVDPAKDIEVRVVDAAGQPVAGALVRATIYQRSYSSRSGDEQETDSEGRATIPSVAVSDTVPIRVRSKEGVSLGPTIVTFDKPNEVLGRVIENYRSQFARGGGQTAVADGPVTIVVSEANAVFFRGKVVDEKGTPIAGAKVSVGTYFPYVSKWLQGGMWTSGSAGAVTTLPDGTFLAGPLWHDLTYSLTATAPDYGKAEAPQTQGVLRNPVDLAPLVLSRRAGPAAGTVVDTAGRPIEGARVFTVGEPVHQPATAVSDARGAFRLTNIGDGPLYVFADKSGYRFGGVKGIDDDAERMALRIVLRRNDEPPRDIAPIERPPREEEVAIARELIQVAWNMPMSPRWSTRLQLLTAAVKIDPKFASELLATADPVFADRVQASLFERRFAASPDDAIIDLIGRDDAASVDMSLKLALRLAGSGDAADKSRTRMLASILAKPLAERADNVRGPRLALVYHRLDEDDKARELIEEAITSIPNVLEGRQRNNFSAAIATALAPYDWDRALQMLGAAGRGSASDPLSDMIVEVAYDDADRALAALAQSHKEIDHPSYRDRLRIRIARVVARKAVTPEEAARAVQVVRESEEPNGKALGLAWLATDIARHDRELAWKMIDEALAMHRGGERELFRSYVNYGGIGPFAAHLAYQAKQVGYPDMESVVWQVLAAWHVRRDFGERQYHLKATVNTARILALVAPAAARDMLLSIEKDRDQLARNARSVSDYDLYLEAWWLANLAKGRQLIADDLAARGQTEEASALSRGVGDYFLVITARPEERLAAILSHELAIGPEEED